MDLIRKIDLIWNIDVIHKEERIVLYTQNLIKLLNQSGINLTVSFRKLVQFRDSTKLVF